MAGPERQPILAGLVSSAAENLYRRLRLAGSVRIGRAPGQVDLDDPATVELLDLGVAFPSGQDDALIRPVDPAVALRLLVKARQFELIAMQRRILDGWDRLTHLLPSAFDVTSASGVDGIRVLTGFEEIATRAAELYPSTRRRLRGTETGAFPARPGGDRARTPPPASVAAGVRFQMIYQADYRDSDVGSKNISFSAESGEEVRLRAKMSVKMLHVDDSIALLGLDRSGQTAIMVRAPEILALLAEWFDLLWEHPTSIPYPARDEFGALTEIQHKVLTLMVFNDDEGVARKLDKSVSTVRRHIRGIYQALGVNSRFAAGMVAAKRNWI